MKMKAKLRKILSILPKKTKETKETEFTSNPPEPTVNKKEDYSLLITNLTTSQVTKIPEEVELKKAAPDIAGTWQVGSILNPEDGWITGNTTLTGGSSDHTGD